MSFIEICLHKIPLDEGFSALLGGVNGSSTMRMLLDHKQHVGHKDHREGSRFTVRPWCRRRERLSKTPIVHAYTVKQAKADGTTAVGAVSDAKRFGIRTTPFPASFDILMAKPATDPVLDISERPTRRIHESCCEYTRVEAVFGHTAAHDVGKGYREPATACRRILPRVDRGGGHTTTHLLSRRQSPILHLHAVSLGATSHCH